MSDNNHNQDNPQNSAQEVNIDELEVSVLMLVKTPKAHSNAATFLSRRGWPTSMQNNLQKAIKQMATEKPDFVLVSLNFPHPAISRLAPLFKQTFGVEVVLFCESQDAASLARLSKMGGYKIIGSPSGPNLQRTLRKVLYAKLNPEAEQSTESDSVESSEDSTIRINGQNNDGSFEFTQSNSSSDSSNSNSISNGSYTMESEDLSGKKKKRLKDLNGMNSDPSNGVGGAHIAGMGGDGTNGGTGGGPDLSALLSAMAAGGDSDLNGAGEHDLENSASGASGIAGVVGGDDGIGGGSGSSAGMAGGLAGGEGSKAKKAKPDYGSVTALGRNSGPQGQQAMGMGGKSKGPSNSYSEGQGADQNSGASTSDGPNSANALGPNGENSQDYSANAEEGRPSLKDALALADQKKASAEEGFDPQSNGKKTSAVVGEGLGADGKPKSDQTLGENSSEGGANGSENSEFPPPALGKAVQSKKVSVEKREKFTQLQQAVIDSVKQMCNKYSGEWTGEEPTTELHVLPLQHGDLHGYLVIKLDEESSAARQTFNGLLGEILQENINTKVKGKVMDGIDLGFPAVDFKNWIDERAIFSISSEYYGSKFCIAYMNTSKPLPKLEASSEKQMIKVSLDDISSDHPVNFKAFIHMEKNDKYFLYLKSGRHLLPEQKERLANSEVGNLFIKEIDRVNLEKFIAYSLLKESMLEALKITKKTAA